MIHGNIVRRLRWAIWKSLAWLTTPLRPRSGKKRESLKALYVMYALNVVTFHVILVLLLLMWI